LASNLVYNSLGYVISEGMEFVLNDLRSPGELKLLLVSMEQSVSIAGAKPAVTGKSVRLFKKKQ
jgi:hypothetical protein